MQRVFGWCAVVGFCLARHAKLDTTDTPVPPFAMSGRHLVHGAVGAGLDVYRTQAIIVITAVICRALSSYRPYGR
ncbi:uncharacterized protein C8Q71DRAFT_749680 [Rhodofomes roseus]|uniref:Secreted protein n=1 Tax=Rhodofomes roseus TaxID=34475 RepID=A0ABQ8KNU0_9APHY|nr:uncharacterized protein C8Q71DRAFT_749680 [Rhodofomes roseus]KAH9839481.1 hypothetical protein C8Q71DRAFT_749680 [Rhodofomes roseus]